VIFGDFWLLKVNCHEMDRDRPRLPANWNCYRFSRVSWALAQISCLLLQLFIMKIHVSCWKLVYTAIIYAFG